MAEAAFKAATTKKPEAPIAKPAAVPGVKEQVTLRIDQDVLEYFQAEGPGWQDRINAALRTFLRTQKLDRGIKGDYVKENGRRLLNAAKEIVNLGVTQWTRS